MIKYLVFIFLLLGLAPVVVNAQQVLNQPSCPNGTLTLNLDCQRSKLFNPNTDCALYSCTDPNNLGQDPGTSVDDKLNLNFFGTTLNLSKNGAVGQLMFLGVMLFLAVVALYLTFVGIIAAYQRTQAESDKELEKSNKTITNALTGLVLIVMAVVIAQLVASFLGLGSINQIVSFNGILGI